MKNELANCFSLITQDYATRRAFQIADKVASTGVTVLITGETGTGKEVMANYIYQKSDRANKSYVTINCAAIPETLLESELFGYEKGAFTDAAHRKIGKFEEANHGTILLDEISEIPLNIQAKLLRVIQEKEISRLGGNGVICIDVRIIAASNCDLYQEVLSGNFRKDLFYRLNVIPIEMPRLNDRPSDIESFAKFFCEKYSAGKKTLSNRFISELKNRNWPGNIRELENTIHREVLLSSEQIIDNFTLNCCESHGKKLKQMEKDTILRTVEKFNGNKTLTSRELGIPLRTLRYKLNSYKKIVNE